MPGQRYREAVRGWMVWSRVESQRLLSFARENCSFRQVNMIAFLAPNLVKAAAEGRLPRAVGVERLRDPPTSGQRSCRTCEYIK